MYTYVYVYMYIYVHTLMCIYLYIFRTLNCQTSINSQVTAINLRTTHAQHKLTNNTISCTTMCCKTQIISSESYKLMLENMRWLACWWAVSILMSCQHVHEQAACWWIVYCSLTFCNMLQWTATQCVLQRATVCCSVLQCVAMCCSMLLCVAVCCSVLQNAAQCCIV